MATALTDTVLNYSGILYSKTDDNTRLLDAVFSRGKRFGDGIFGIGRRKVSSTEFVLASGYSLPDGKQPSISEQASTTAPAASPITRAQEKNFTQIFQETVDVSYRKQSAIGNLAGVNIAGQSSNVTNELDWQATQALATAKKNLNYTLINGVKQEATTSGIAAQSEGLINGIKTNVATGTAVSSEFFNSAIATAMTNGFNFDNGNMELWVNPMDLDKINEAFANASGFNLPSTRTEGGLAITNIMTNYGTIVVSYDSMIPVDTLLLLNIRELSIAELDYIDKDNVNRGVWFYEQLAKNGAAERGQIYADTGIDYGAERKHIKFEIAAPRGL